MYISYDKDSIKIIEKKKMSIYQFINFIYNTYGVTMRKEKNTIKIEYNEGINSITRRAIGEEITDFLKHNPKYTFLQHHNSFDIWRYNNKR